MISLPQFSTRDVLMKRFWLWRMAAYLSIVFISPLAGVWLTHKPLSPYLAFPPIPISKPSLAFSWIAFLPLTIFIIICIAPFMIKIISANVQPEVKPPITQPFPHWGWLSVVMLSVFWVIAWNRFTLFESLQMFTFTPLWIGYILVINALTFSRSGRCSLLDRTPYFVLLFPLSAIFWWSFEYLNRFVANWHYVGIDDIGSWNYFFLATLPFATVLPAVLSTEEYLATFPRLSAGLNQFPGFTITAPQVWAWSLISLSVIFLIALAVWPEPLFFLVWLIPISLVCGLQMLTEKPLLLNETATGNWQRVWRLALASLVCGFFWEMWNVHSLAHWKYNVPYVQDFMIFEMPLLGYAGYLPFGIICGLFVDFTIARTK